MMDCFEPQIASSHLVTPPRSYDDLGVASWNAAGQSTDEAFAHLSRVMPQEMRRYGLHLQAVQGIQGQVEGSEFFPSARLRQLGKVASASLEQAYDQAAKGMALFSTMALLSSPQEHVLFERKSRQPRRTSLQRRVCQETRVQWGNNGSARVLQVGRALPNVSWQEERMQQDKLIRVAGELIVSDVPVIVCGSAREGLGSEVIRGLEAQGLYLVQAARTRPTLHWGELAQTRTLESFARQEVDFIFASSHLEVVRSGAEGPRRAERKLLWAKLRLR